MKKMIKMSLIASVAIAGLTTTASATAMEDSIKNTDLSGYIRYRYTNGQDNAESNAYKTVFVTKSKVNDMVTAKLKIAGEGKTYNGDDKSTVAVEVGGDADPDTTAVKEANFIFNLGGNTIIAGKQGLVTPFADAGDQQGTGIVGLFPVGPVTLAAGWYTNTDAKAGHYANTALTGANIGAIAAIGAAGPVNYSLWYADVAQGHTNEPAANIGAKAINVNVAGKFGPVSVEVNHAEVKYTNDAAGAADPKAKQTRIVVGANAGPVALTLGYVKTGDEGGNTTLGDTDAKSNFILEDVSASATMDASIWYAAAKAPVGPVTVGFEYLTTSDMDGTTDAVGSDEKANETKLSVAYAMSKNFTISAFMTNASTETKAGVETELDKSRLEMKYTF